jgi:shikimate kinase
MLLAGTAALGTSMEPLDIVQMGVDAAIDARVTLTGAFDDAVATMCGGAVLTDNIGRRVVSRPEFPPNLEVVFLVPERRIEKSSLHREDFAVAREDVAHAFALAAEGRIAEAITMNGRAYAPLVGVDTAPADAALAAGAWAAGMTGTGPAIAVLVAAKEREAVLAALTPFKGRVITTRPNLSPASVIPKEEHLRHMVGVAGGVRHG